MVVVELPWENIVLDCVGLVVLLELAVLLELVVILALVELEVELAIGMG